MDLQNKPVPNSTRPSPLNDTAIWMAMQALLRRIDTIDAACSGSFPLYARKDGNWAVSAGGSWVGGFWSGCWWVRARLRGSLTDQRKARHICRSLAPKIAADSVNRSLIFWYSAGLGDLWFDDEAARCLAEDAAAALIGSYDPRLRCIPLGTDLGGGKDGHRRIAVDAWAALLQLLGRMETYGYDRILRAHTDTLADVCGTGDGAFHSEAHCEGYSLIPEGIAGDWSRGQAWAMLGLVRAAARWYDPYLHVAYTACEYWLRSRPMALPPHRLSDPARHCDPSAAVIAALAMLSLADLLPDDGKWRSEARRLIGAVIDSPYFISSGDKHGTFWGCSYKTQAGEEELVESAWGSFMLLAALGALAETIEPGQL